MSGRSSQIKSHTAYKPFIPHFGGECPVKAHQLVDVEFADGTVASDNFAAVWYSGTSDWWKHESNDPLCNIVAYRLSEVKN